MKNLLFILGSFAIILVNHFIIPSISIGSIKPDFIVIIVILGVWIYTPNTYLNYIFLLGIWSDVFSIEPLGYNMIQLLIIGYLLLLIRLRLIFASFIINVLFLLFACIFRIIVQYVLSLFFRVEILKISFFKTSLSIAYTLILGLVILFFVRIFREHINYQNH